MYSLWDTNYRLQTHAYTQEEKARSHATNATSRSNPFKSIHSDELDGKKPLQFKAIPKEKASFSIKREIKKIKSALTDFFQGFTRRMVYIGHGYNLKRDKLLAEIKQLEKKENKPIQDQTNELEKLISEAEKMNTPNSHIEKLKVKVEKLNEKVEQLEKINKKEQKGNDIREQLKILGGERIVISTPDQLNLDGMYLDARKFRETLKNAGGKLVSYEIEKANSQTKNFRAISLSRENFDSSGKQVLEALKFLHGTSDILVGGGGAGWTAVYNGEEVLLVNSKDISGASDSEGRPSLFKYNHPLKRWEIAIPSAATKLEQEINQSESGGTVVLCSCAKTIYEMHKEDALFYLFKNMNVVLFNYRGYGKSEGIPSGKGLKIDVESAFQFAKQKSGHEDQQILFSATCMGGGPAAYVASKHPKTNIFLDQSYSNFKKLSKELVEFKLKEFLNDLFNISEPQSLKAKAVHAAAMTFGSIINLFTDFMVPNFEIDKYLSKNKGKKAILFTKSDEIINIKHVERNLKAIPQEEMKNVTVFSTPGTHGDRILMIDSARAEYLKENVELYELYSHLVNSKHQLDFQKNSAVLDKEESERIDLNIIQTYEDIKLVENNPAEINLKRRLERKLKIYTKQKKRIQHRDSEIEKIEKQIDEIKIKIAQILPAELDASILRKENIAMNQLGHFLKKAELSKDLI